MRGKTDVTEYPHIRNLADPHGLYLTLQAYLTWLNVKNYSSYTIANREYYLYCFLEWAGQRGLVRPTEITKPILERYQRHLFYYRKQNGDPLSIQDQYNRSVALRHWFKWLAKQNYLLYNPASELELPRLERRLPRAVLSAAEAESVLNQVDIATLMGLRDRAILETFYSTGIRRLELINLLVSDIDSECGTLMVRLGKGKKDRMIPIGERALQWIDRYLQDTRPELACGADEGVLFLTNTGHAIGKNRLTSLVRKYVLEAKINKGGSCHLFRHTMATLMLENGADIRYIQAMLGHVDLSTTEIYTQVSIKKLKAIHTLTHPAKASRRQSVSKLPETKDLEPTAEDLLTVLAAESLDDPE